LKLDLSDENPCNRNKTRKTPDFASILEFALDNSGEWKEFENLPQPGGCAGAFPKVRSTSDHRFSLVITSASFANSIRSSFLDHTGRTYDSQGVEHKNNLGCSRPNDLRRS